MFWNSAFIKDNKPWISYTKKNKFSVDFDSFRKQKKTLELSKLFTSFLKYKVNNKVWKSIKFCKGQLVARQISWIFLIWWN